MVVLVRSDYEVIKPIRSRAIPSSAVILLQLRFEGEEEFQKRFHRRCNSSNYQDAVQNRLRKPVVLRQVRAVISNSQNLSRSLHVGETSAGKQALRSATVIGETSRRSTNEQTIEDPPNLSPSSISTEESLRLELVDGDWVATTPAILNLL